jgi:hypothetical protein
MTWPDAQQTEPSLSRMHLVLFLAGAGVFLYLRTFLLPATPFAATDDQSLFFARAVCIVQGQVPYRDFFEIVTPGTDLIYAVGSKLSKLLNQEDALSGPCLRGDFYSPHAPSRSAGILRKGLISHF